MVAPGAPGAERHRSIDTVLDLVAGLDARPVEEHAAAFETAHQQLRQALDETPE